jgi:hypothetical protein
VSEKKYPRPPSMPGRSRPHGVPISIDAELTPPPQEPPSPDTLRGYDSIPSPIRDQLDMLAQGLGEVTAALGKVWDARKDGERLDRIDSKLATLADHATKHETMLDQFVVPAIKDGMRATDEVASQMPVLVQQLATLTSLLTAVDNRLRTYETNLVVITRRFEDSELERDERHMATEKRLNTHDDRIEELERKERDRIVVSKALAKSERVKSGGITAAVAAGIVTLAEVIHRYL